MRYSLSLSACVLPCAPIRVASRPTSGGDASELGVVLGGTPLLTFAFNNMVMDAEKPEVWSTADRAPAKTGRLDMN
jgi:hypothetical protein